MKGVIVGHYILMLLLGLVSFGGMSAYLAFLERV